MITLYQCRLKRIDGCLNYDLNRVYLWLSADKLTLNLTKTEFMSIVLRQSLSSFSEISSFTINDDAGSIHGIARGTY